jgi:hypothetical protein
LIVSPDVDLWHGQTEVEMKKQMLGRNELKESFFHTEPDTQTSYWLLATDVFEQITLNKNVNNSV